MEQNFDPQKEGDYKYILKEERCKETGEEEPWFVAPKLKRSDRLWNWFIVRLFRRSKQAKQLKLSFPVLLEFFS
nr:hypothetical protein [uncultured Lacibacter sp.]